MMDPQWLHLVLNHVPVIGVLWTLAFLIAALVRPSRTAFMRAHAFAILLGITAGLAYITGDGAEEKIEHLPGVVEAAIEAHQDAATIALVISLAAGVVGIVGYWAAMKNRMGLARKLCMLALLVATFAAGALFNTAHRGGLIHRPELYHGPGGGTERTPD